MAIVTEISWENMFGGKPLPENPARQAWCDAVAEIAAKAKATLPECHGRVDAAVKIALAGDVEMQADGTARVASQTNGSTAYHVVNGHCDCKDFAKAPHTLCKHRLSVAIVRRAHELAQQRLVQSDGVHTTTSQPPAESLQGPQSVAPMLSLPEAPVSITLKATFNGHEVLVTLRGMDFASVKTQVEQASQWLHMQPPTQGTGQPFSQEVPYCHTHKVPLQPFTKAGRTWYSHKTPDGSWCKGK